MKYKVKYENNSGETIVEETLYDSAVDAQNQRVVNLVLEENVKPGSVTVFRVEE